MMRPFSVAALLCGCALAMGAPVGPSTEAEAPTDANRPGRQLKAKVDMKSLEATYDEVNANLRTVQDRYKPIIDKMLTNKMPDFLTDFMTSIKGFSSDLSWVAEQPAISSMLHPDPSKPAEPNSVPLPATLSVGPGLPTTKSCGSSGICKDVVEWVRNVNGNMRQGTEPSPLMQVAMQNKKAQAARATNAAMAGTIS